MAQADIALIGLAVMGQNLVLNMADHGFTVAVFNPTVVGVKRIVNVVVPAAAMLVEPGCANTENDASPLTFTAGLPVSRSVLPTVPLFVIVNAWSVLLLSVRLPKS